MKLLDISFVHHNQKSYFNDWPVRKIHLHLLNPSFDDCCFSRALTWSFKTSFVGVLETPRRFVFDCLSLPYFIGYSIEWQHFVDDRFCILILILEERFFQETMQETSKGDFENLADIELTDIPDPASLYDFSELCHSLVNLSSTLVTHREEDCVLRMELAAQPILNEPHCIASVDNEVLSSSHQGRYTTQPLCIES